ncbi:hypothetical protein EDB19DRAFT_2023775 [Suillus lakei]|nr:hypothetical protein EDB19DRAFT_2023775 [Suillus lakei]
MCSGLRARTPATEPGPTALHGGPAPDRPGTSATPTHATVRGCTTNERQPAPDHPGTTTNSGKLSISMMLTARAFSNLALQPVRQSAMHMQEFSHHVSVTQTLGELKKATTGRELRWKGVAKLIERSPTPNLCLTIVEMTLGAEDDQPANIIDSLIMKGRYAERKGKTMILMWVLLRIKSNQIKSDQKQLSPNSEYILKFENLDAKPTYSEIGKDATTA